MKILIVEDSPTQAASIRQRLSAMGHEVTVASDGLRALEELTQQHYPVVISDWVMPSMDGLELCRRIRADLRDRPYIFIILLTSKDLRHERLEGLEAGADIFVSKPLDNIEISVALKVVARQLESQTALLDRIACLEKQGSTDPETGLPTRSQLLELLSNTLVRASTDGLPLSLVLLEIELANPGDNPAHSIQAINDLLDFLRRPGDFVARLRDRTLGWIIPGLLDFSALELTEQVILASSQSSVLEGNVVLHAGVTTWSPGSPPVSTSQLLEQADLALRHARAGGSPRAVHHAEMPSPIGHAAP